MSEFYPVHKTNLRDFLVGINFNETNNIKNKLKKSASLKVKINRDPNKVCKSPSHLKQIHNNNEIILTKMMISNQKQRVNTQYPNNHD